MPCGGRGIHVRLVAGVGRCGAGFLMKLSQFHFHGAFLFMSECEKSVLQCAATSGLFTQFLLGAQCDELTIVYDADAVGIKVLCSPDRKEQTLFVYDRKKKKLFADQTHGSLNPETSVLRKGGSYPNFPIYAADLDLRDDERLELHAAEEGLMEFRGVLAGENGQGMLQNMTYYIEAGDARSRVFQLQVIDAADLGNEDAELTVGDAQDHDLAWYAPQELPFLLELL